MIVDADTKCLTVRRSLRQVKNGFAYDTNTASKIWCDEHIHNEYCFRGVALYQNIYGHYFLHQYHQWERFNGITPLTIKDAIEITEKYRPMMVEEVFGFLPEQGQGEPYTPM